MRLQFSLRALLLAVFVVAILLAVLRPVAKITPATCERIRPGMTEQEAFQLVGVPPGWYDGVGVISTDAPAYKGYKPFWVGAGGEVVVDLDESGRVTKATFYPAKALDWSFGDWLWERLTRMRFLGLSMPQRIAAFVVGTTLAVWALAVIVIRPRTPNHVAKHGARSGGRCCHGYRPIRGVVLLGPHGDIFPVDRADPWCRPGNRRRVLQKGRRSIGGDPRAANRRSADGHVTKCWTRAAIWSGKMVALTRRGLVNIVVRRDGSPFPWFQRRMPHYGSPSVAHRRHRRFGPIDRGSSFRERAHCD